MVLVCGAECPKQRLGCAEWVMGIGGWGQTQSAGCGRLMVKENGNSCLAHGEGEWSALAHETSP